MPNFRPFSACWGDISFTEAPHTTTRCYAGAMFLSCNPSEHPRRGGHRRNRAHLETQSLTTVPVGGSGARPDNEPTQRATHSNTAPPVWRAPEGPQGLAVWRPRAAGPGRASPSTTSAAGVEGTGGTGGPDHGARGRQRGQAGLRGDAPSGARGADGERAGRRPRAHQTARPSRARKAAQPAISDSRAPSGSPTRKQHPPGQASAPNRRRRARDPRPRR